MAFTVYLVDEDVSKASIQRRDAYYICKLHCTYGQTMSRMTDDSGNINTDNDSDLDIDEHPRALLKPLVYQHHV